MKPLEYWENLKAEALEKQAKLLVARADLAPSVLTSAPSKWYREGERWRRKATRAYVNDLKAHHLARTKWARLKREIAKVEQSLIYIEERLADRRDAWDHIRASAKEAGREARRRCITPG